MNLTTEEIGQTIKTTRKGMGLTQRALAVASGTGLRFIIELEKGKPTCQLGKVLTVFEALGITLKATLPAGNPSSDPVRQSNAERFTGMSPVEPQWD